MSPTLFFALLGLCVSLDGVSKATKASPSFLDGSSRLPAGLLTQGPWPDPGEAGWTRLDCPHSTWDCRLPSAWPLCSAAQSWDCGEIRLVGSPAGGLGLVPRGIPLLELHPMWLHPWRQATAPQVPSVGSWAERNSCQSCWAYLPSFLFFFLAFKRRWGWSLGPYAC